jgi:hypothetical protein
MTTNEAQRDILNQAAKKLIKRIKELQARLKVEEKECSEMGHYEDCGEFYHKEVASTKAVIDELISQKISFEKWRKSLKV